MKRKLVVAFTMAHVILHPLSHNEMIYLIDLHLLESLSESVMALQNLNSKHVLNFTKSRANVSRVNKPTGSSEQYEDSVKFGGQ